MKDLTMRFLLGLLFSLFIFTPAFADDMKITVAGLSCGSALPELYTCDSTGFSPTIKWENASPKAKSLALLVIDPDAPMGTVIHWFIFNIPPTTKELSKGITNYPKGTVVGKNTGGNFGWKAPCPPANAPKHHYLFTLYTLDKKLDLSANATVDAFKEAMHGHVLDQAEATLNYQRK